MKHLRGPILHTLIALACLTLIANAQAKQLTSLYTATLNVPNQSIKTRRRLLPKAFLQVLIKISGNPQIKTLPIIQASLKSSAKWVQQYSYEKVPPPEDAAQAASQPPIWHLHLTFQKRSVNRLLREAGQPIWGNKRPEVLAWIVIDDHAPTYFVSPTSANESFHTVKTAAQTYGIPVLFPLLDLQDLSTISTEKIQNFDSPTITLSSQRYHAPIIAVIAVAHADTLWQAKWQLILGLDKIAWATEGDTLPHLMATIFRQINQTLAKRYAIDSTANPLQPPIQITIENVKNVRDYARVAQYLKQLTPVKSIHLKDIFPNGVTYTIDLSSNLDALEQSIHLDQKLQLADDTHPDRLFYRWRTG